MFTYETIPPEEFFVLPGDSHVALQKFRGAGIMFDSIVTDPPWGIAGKFDALNWGPQALVMSVWRDCLALVKPGSYLLTTAHPKTLHHQMLAVEKAGWNIRDVVIWLYGDGFAEFRGEAKKAVHRALLGRKADMTRGIIDRRALRWSDYGGTIKPSWEPIILAQKPGIGMGRNLIEHQVGALNQSKNPTPYQLTLFDGGFGDYNHPPTNVITDDEVWRDIKTIWGPSKTRAFYDNRRVMPKERRAGAPDNDHPTLNPISTFRLLIRLVTPPGGTVLDPFCGSGTTGCAAMLEDCRFVGIDIDPHYVGIARGRIDHYRRRMIRDELRQLQDARMGLQTKVKFMNDSKKKGPNPKAASDMKRPSASRCPNGHLRTPENTYIRPDGRRECKICKKQNKTVRKVMGKD